MNSEELSLVVIGISHKTSGISEREIFQINRKKIPEAVNYLKSITEVEGIVIISTCNRLEFYFTVKKGTDSYQIITDFYCERNILKAPIKKELFYVHKGIDVARHLFKVITGLDSMVIGEYQIQGQIKDSYSIACSHKTADKILHKLFHAAFRTGKAVRSGTKIGNGQHSVSGITFNIIKKKLDRKDIITIVGVNQNTKIIAERLSNEGFNHLIFVNRTFYKAEELAEKYKGHAFSLDFIEDAMINSKCVLSCTGAPGFIINSALINHIYNRMKLPSLLIDMAVPRDIDSRGIREGIEVIDMEGLNKYLEDEEEEIALDIPEAERIINSEVQIFGAWNEAQKDDTISLLDEKIEAIRLQLLNEQKLRSTEEELGQLDKFSHCLIHRMKTVITQTFKMNQENNLINKE
jgi:glutamyl-tRNA reductase